MNPYLQLPTIDPMASDDDVRLAVATMLAQAEEWTDVAEALLMEELTVRRLTVDGHGGFTITNDIVEHDPVEPLAWSGAKVSARGGKGRFANYRCSLADPSTPAIVYAKPSFSHDIVYSQILILLPRSATGQTPDNDGGEQ